jgi:hypothetical protein
VEQTVKSIQMHAGIKQWSHLFLAVQVNLQLL